jgi:hypothetical protein
MKLSDKILAGFFGFAFIYLTAVFAEVRLRGIPNNIIDTNSIAETVDIPDVAYLVLEDVDYNVAVIGSDHARLEVRSISGDLLETLKYNISGDTLTLSDFQWENRRTARITAFIPQTSLKGISVKAAVATVKGLDQKLLHISQNGGRISMSDNRIGKLHLEISGKSHLNITATPLDTLSAKIENSEVLIYSPVGLLEGSMKNNSFLRMNAIGEIQFKKDETSRVNFY